MQHYKQSGNLKSLQLQLWARQVRYGEVHLLVKHDLEHDNVLCTTSAAIPTNPCVLNIEL